MNSSPDEEGEEPEPQKDVNLFVDDVDGQDAKAVLGFHRSRCTIIAPGAFRHLGEDFAHGIGPVLDGQLADLQHIGAIFQKLSTQKEIHEPNLENDVDQIQNFAQDKLVDVRLVVAFGSYQIIQRCQTSI